MTETIEKAPCAISVASIVCTVEHVFSLDFYSALDSSEDVREGILLVKKLVHRSFYSVELVSWRSSSHVCRAKKTVSCRLASRTP